MATTQGTPALSSDSEKLAVCSLLHAAVAGVQEHQGQRPAVAADGLDQLLRRGGDGLAVLVFELELPRAAVAGEVQHVVGVALDRRGDDPGMAHLEDPHLDVLMPLGRLHRVEDVLQLPLVVEHGRAV